MGGGHVIAEALAISIVVPLSLYVWYRNRHLKFVEAFAILMMSILGVASGMAWVFLGIPRPSHLIGIIIVCLIPMATIEFMIINKYRSNVSWLNFMRINKDSIFCYFSVGFCAALLI
jgi:uncharacterized membrane protein YfcA